MFPSDNDQLKKKHYDMYDNKYECYPIWQCKCPDMGNKRKEKYENEVDQEVEEKCANSDSVNSAVCASPRFWFMFYVVIIGLYAINK